MERDRDANGLFTDAFVVAFGERMTLDDALTVQYATGRPLVDTRWLMSCISRASVISYEDHMIVNTLTMHMEEN